MKDAIIKIRRKNTDQILKSFNYGENSNQEYFNISYVSLIVNINIKMF